MWLGYGFNGNVAFFESPYEDIASSAQHREGMIRVSGVAWFTNLDIKKRHEEMILVRRYSPEAYPKYVNFDAIEVSKVADIPCDFAGKMGVPITFMDKFNPEQFDLLGYSLDLAWPISDYVPLGKNYVKGGNCFYLDNGEMQLTRLYDRLVIRNRHPEPPRPPQGNFK